MKIRTLISVHSACGAVVWSLANAGCSAPNVKPEPATHVSQTLNGVWKQTGLECRGGTPTKTDLNTMEAYRTGRVVGILHVEGELADFDVKQYRSPTNHDDYCRWIAQEKWQPEADGVLKISNLKINQHGFGRSLCQGTSEYPSERRYEYELNGSSLKLIAPLPTSRETKDCPGGQAVLSFERML